MASRRTTPEPEGFRPEPDEYKVTYEQPGFVGLVAHFDDLSVGEALDIDVLLYADTETSQERRERLTALYGAIAPHLLSWNLLHPKTGLPVPPTVEGLLSLKQEFVSKVINGYLLARRGVDDPLGDGSTSGDPSLEASMQMETL